VRQFFEHSWADGPIPVGCDEDNRDVLPPNLQFPLQSGPFISSSSTIDTRGHLFFIDSS
jgi:hypothetical protein